MKEATAIEQVAWPEFDISENFEFDAIAQGGTFKFHFRWLNDRWNLWVTLPDETVRQASVYPGVISWTGYSDWGIVIKSNMEKIDYSNLLLSEVYIITWL